VWSARRCDPEGAIASALRAFAAPLAETLTRTRFLSLCREMRAFDKAPTEQRQAVQTARLAALLQGAMRRVPFWRARAAAAGIIEADLERDPYATLAHLPLTRKRDLREGFPDAVTAEGARDEWRFSASAGTSDRATVVTDFRKRDHGRASDLRALRMTAGQGLGASQVEIPPQACNIACGLADDAPQALRAYLARGLGEPSFFAREGIAGIFGRIERRVLHRRLTLLPIDPAPPDTLRRVLDARLDAISQERPSVLRGLPHFLLWLSDRARARGLRFPGLRAILPFGGLLSPAIARRVEAGFGAPFRDVYGTGELGIVGAACGRSAGVHVFEDLFVVEVLRDGRPARAGERGAVVVTDLVNAAMPLVRYDVGDVGSLDAAPCACGRAGPRLILHGRAVERLTHAGGGEAVDAADVHAVLFSRPEVANARVEALPRGRFAATVVPTDGAPAPDLEEIAEALRALLGCEERPRVRTAPFLRPETSGKYRVGFPLATPASAEDGS